MKAKFLLTAILFGVAIKTAYATAPTITSFSPASGPVGTLVTVSGTNLAGPTAFTIGGRVAIVLSNNGTQLVGFVMPNAATGAIAITTVGGTVSSSTNFIVTATSYPSQQKGNPIITATNYGQAEIGSSVAISADGTTAIVGGPYYYSGVGINPGVALVFVYSGGMWTQQAEFSASNFSPQEGRSVALSADGNTAMVGGSGDDSTNVNGNTGAVWFYSRVGAVWSEEGKPVIGTGYALYPSQGFSCALSADGNTAIESGFYDNGGIGAAWIFTRSNGTWTQQGPKLVPSDNTGNANFGNSVAISADGNTAVVGGYNDNASVNTHNDEIVVGATWIFTRTGSIWSQQGSKLVATGGSGNDYQGTSVGVSADGNTLVTSGPNSNSVWIFTRNGTTWSQLGSALPETGVTGNPGNGIQAGFGSGVAISADGNTVVVGDSQNGSFDGPGPGGTWVFTRSGNTYVQQEGALMGTGTGTTQYPSQGAAVALSANGTAFITGGPPNGTNYQGAAWVFAAVTPVLQSQTITFAQPTAVTYGSADFAPVATSNNATIPITFTSGNPLIFTVTAGGKIHIVGAGTTTITANQAGNGVYNPAAPVQQSFTVLPAPLTIKANNATRVSGIANPTFTVIYTGFVNGDTKASLSQLPTVTTTATPSSALGNYPITPANASAANYNISYVAGNLAVTASHNANLGSIKTSPASNLTGTGSGATFVNYVATVPNTTSSVTVTATVQDVTATIKVNGAATASGIASASIPLAVGSNTITTVVTAQDGTTTKTYTITVTRLGNASLASLKLTPALNMTGTGSGATFVNYAATAPNTTSSVTVTATVQDAAATIKVNGTTVASATPSQSIPLTVGSNVINTVVTAPDGVTTKTYTITVTRAGNASLASIKLTPALNMTGTGSGATFVNYAATAPNTTSSVTVTATVQDATATIKVNGITTASGAASASIPLSVGSNTITTVVTAQDGVTTKTYTITVTRALSTDALLTSLKLTPTETLTIVAGPDYIDYTASVHNTTSSVTVTPTAQAATATIIVNGTTVASGAASQSIALAVGPNTIKTVVTAQDGVTSKTYSITITRAMTGMNSFYEPISVTKPTNGTTIENDGILVHQGVSPNGDGINDFLTIDGIINYPDNRLMIMDRNGVMVYQTKGYDNSSKLFDGHSSINGAMQLPGTYFYSLDYTVNGLNKHKTGFIILKY